MMWFLTEKFKIRRDGTDQWLDLLLRKRASPKLDIESIRNSCTRDLRLAHSEIFPELASSPHTHCSIGTVLVQRMDKMEDNIDRWI